MDRPAAGPGPGEPAGRGADLRLARLHLRLGSTALARAELEAASTAGPLPSDALVDLAEVRWRSGDLSRAGEAAAAALASGANAPVAQVIAIEAASIAAASTEGWDRDRADSVMASVGPKALNELFAGLPRSAAWPSEAAAGWDGAERSARPMPLSQPGVAGRDRQVLREPSSVPAPPLPRADRADDGGGRGGDPATELDAAADDLAAGDDSAAAVRLAVLLRAVPATAPAVVELLEDAKGPLLSIVRGDALRLTGRTADAERAWAGAVAALSHRRSAGLARPPGSSAAASTSPSSPPGDSREAGQDPLPSVHPQPNQEEQS